MKINKLIIITVLTTVLMSVNAFAETVRAIELNLTYDGKTVEYREKEVKVFVDGEQPVSYTHLEEKDYKN